MFSQKRKEKKAKVFIDQVQKEKAAPKQQEGKGIILTFMPVFSKDIFDDEIVEKLKLYLVNQDTITYNFTYNLFMSNMDTIKFSNCNSTRFYTHICY